MKSKYLFKSPMIVTSFVLLIIALILIIINNRLFQQSLVDYISGTVTEIFGIIITVLFVQLIFEKKSTDNRKDEELRKILRSDRIIRLLIDNYTLFLHCMIHDYNEIIPDNPTLHVDFKISDLKYLHNRCLLMKMGHDRLSISLFYESELELRNIFISIIQNIDLHFFPEISSLLLEYIKASYQFDSRGEILNNEKIYTSTDKKEKKEFTSVIKELLEQNAEQFMNDYFEGKITHANIMFPYMSLYIMIKKQKEILIKYNEIIKSNIRISQTIA